MPSLADKTAVWAHLEGLCLLQPPLADPDTFQLYEEAFEELMGYGGSIWGEVIGEARWQSVKAHPKNEELSKSCFQECLAKDDLYHAGQVC